MTDEKPQDEDEFFHKLATGEEKIIEPGEEMEIIHMQAILSADKYPPFVKVTIVNPSNDCLEVEISALMLSGKVWRSNFVVIDKLTDEALPYLGISAKRKPVYVQIEANSQIVSGDIDLSFIYDLENGKRYEVYYKSYISCHVCSELQAYRSEFSESNHVEITGVVHTEHDYDLH